MDTTLGENQESSADISLVDHSLADFNPEHVDSILGLQLGGSNLGSTEGSSNEIVTKAKRTRPKITPDMLVSKKGLPYIRANKKSVIKNLTRSSKSSKNLTNFLRFYQTWAHNLFPLAKLRDFTDLVMKHGSAQSVKRFREEWILEDMNTVQGAPDPDLDRFETTHQHTYNDSQKSLEAFNGASITQTTEENADSISRTQNNRNRSNSLVFQGDEDDLYTTTKTRTQVIELTNDPESGNNSVPKDIEPEDVAQSSTTPATPTTNQNDDFDDFDDDEDLDLLLRNKISESNNITKQTTVRNDQEIPQENDFVPNGDEFEEPDLQDEYDIMNEMGL